MQQLTETQSNFLQNPNKIYFPHHCNNSICSQNSLHKLKDFSMETAQYTGPTNGPETLPGCRYKIDTRLLLFHVCF